ncbi:hypothetical protein MKW92_026982 [Papaver armeniacum]|nr:hypothetical protein MKW92_026982 [Papaver armeniacum]
MGRVAESSLSLKRKRADTPKLSEAERTIYDLIISTEDTGIWTRDIKYKIKVIPDTVVNKSIKSLKDKQLIKEVVNIQNKGKKKSLCSLYISRMKVATVGEITEAVNNSGVFKEDVKFTGKQIEDLCRSASKNRALASIPCGVCPRLNECTPDGIISPTTCVYFKKWLDF